MTDLLAGGGSKYMKLPRNVLSESFCRGAEDGAYEQIHSRVMSWRTPLNNLSRWLTGEEMSRPTKHSIPRIRVPEAHP